MTATTILLDGKALSKQMEAELKTRVQRIIEKLSLIHI